MSQSDDESLDETIALQRVQLAPENAARVTEDAAVDGANRVNDSGSNSRPIRQMQLLEGSGPKLSDELDLETLSRLRLVAMLLFGGFLAFLTYRIFFDSGTSRPLDQVAFVAHITMTFVTGLVSFRTSLGRAMKRYEEGDKDKAESKLSSCLNEHGAEQCKFIAKMRLTGWHLRISEIAVFGGSAIFFLILSMSLLIDGGQRGFFAQINGPWILLIFTYALFMPNDWQRAARVIVPFAICPLGAMAVAWFGSESFRQVLNDPHYSDALPTTALTMGFASLVAIHGVRTIRSLRKEVFQAQQLGQYRLKKLLGSGGMGDVYEAEHLLLKRACAIKLIKPEQAGNELALQRFEREVRATAKLRHWNTVDIYDYGHSEDGTFYYVMEYLIGKNLQELVELDGAMSEQRVAALIRQVCDALSEAHGAGMVHRDIKPANIFLTELGNQSDVVKLLDFGLVRPIVADHAELQLTQQNTVLGSPLFMPPEQASGDDADVRSDIYSLGGVAYFLLSGRPPFSGKSAIEVIMAHARKTPSSLTEFGVSEAMATIVMRCLEKEASQRFQSVEDLKTALLNLDATAHQVVAN